jgi:hypothetical protein
VFIRAPKLVAALESLAFGQCTASLQNSLRLATATVSTYTERRLRPLRRRRLNVARPRFVRVRFKNPNLRCRRILDGWYVRFMCQSLIWGTRIIAGTTRLSTIEQSGWKRRISRPRPPWSRPSWRLAGGDWHTMRY